MDVLAVFFLFFFLKRKENRDRPGTGVCALALLKDSLTDEDDDEQQQYRRRPGGEKKEEKLTAFAYSRRNYSSNDSLFLLSLSLDGDCLTKHNPWLDQQIDVDTVFFPFDLNKFVQSSKELFD